MSSTDFLKELLSHDPIDEAYKISQEVGASEKEAMSLGFILFQGHNKLKQELMESLNDTFYNMEWGYCEELLKGLGFVEEYFELFNLWKYDDNILRPPEFYTLWIHKDLPILISLESYSSCSSHRVNSINAHYCIKQTQENKKEVWDLHLHNRTPLIIYNREEDKEELCEQVKCTFSGKEGLKVHLSEIQQYLHPDPWKEIPFLWLLNYEETKENSGNHQSISINKLKKCKSAHRFIGWEEKE
jgi:hypothetical protein